MEKEIYFKDQTRFKDTVASYFGSTNSHIIYKIDRAIVNKIIGEMFFHPDDHDSITCAHVLKLFTSSETGYYTITINSPLQFRLVVEYLAAGLSFRQVMNIFNKTKKLTGIVELRNIKDGQ